MFCKFEELENGIQKCIYCGFSFKANTPVPNATKTCAKAPKDQPKSMPSVTQQAKNLGKSVVNMVKNKAKMVSKKEQARRLEICTGSDTVEKCEFYQDGRCSLCGCFTALKTKVESEHCPVEKW